MGVRGINPREIPIVFASLAETFSDEKWNQRIGDQMSAAFTDYGEPGMSARLCFGEGVTCLRQATAWQASRRGEGGKGQRPEHAVARPVHVGIES